MFKYSAYINGEFIDKKEKIDIYSPQTQDVIGQVSALDKKDIDFAYNAASIAFNQWSKIQLVKRIEYIEQFKQLIIKNKKEIANLLTSEIAKPTNDALAEIKRTIELIDLTIVEAKNIHPKTLDAKGFGQDNKIGIFTREPIGIICAIAPFNYPFNLALSKIIPSIIMGNTVVFKPATQGSLIGCFIGQLFDQAKFPKGVLNIVTGRGSNIGDYIISHNSAKMIMFTGSIEVGQNIKKIANGKQLVLELGGKDSAIVLDDANLNIAIKHIISGAFDYSGQRCTAIKRIITSNNMANKLVPMLLDKIKNLKVGDPIQNTNVVPLINQKSTNFVLSLIDDAKSKGAKILIGGTHEKNLVFPTLIDNVTVDMKIANLEQFGPILPIIREDNLDKMVEIANNTNYGLQASIFTNDLNKAFSLAKKINVGTININSKTQRGPDIFPFLGIKDSGEGVQGIYESLMSVTRYKGLVINYKD